MQYRAPALILVVAATTLTAACQPTVDLAAEEQAIRDLDAQWVAAVQAGDAAQCASFYAADGYYLEPGLEPAIGPEAIEQAWADGLGVPDSELTFGPVKIVVAQAGDMAWEYGTYQYAAPGIEDHGKYVVVWQKVDGEWKVVADIFNTDVPLEM